MPVHAGETATVVGVVTPVSADVLDAWEAAGTIDANDRIIAEFATHYLDASLVSVSAAACAANSRESAANIRGKKSIRVLTCMNRV